MGGFFAGADAVGAAVGLELEVPDDGAEGGGLEEGVPRWSVKV